MHVLHQAGAHKNVLFSDLTSGAMVQANQHVIVEGSEAMLLDPGGHKVYSRLFAELGSLMPPDGLKYVFLSHQDPDIVASTNGWLMVTEAKALVSALWMRFIPHFGIDDYLATRLVAIPDEGMEVTLGGRPLQIIPAHFLHSPGNFHVFDPSARILYTGDLGASLGAPYDAVSDFAAHMPYMEGFHRRYMASNRALRLWARRARALSPEILAPQHGAYFKGADVGRFIDWAEGLSCGVDLFDLESDPG